MALFESLENFPGTLGTVKADLFLLNMSHRSIQCGNVEKRMRL
jgi:hypothetical protein